MEHFGKPYGVMAAPLMKKRGRPRRDGEAELDKDYAEMSAQKKRLEVRAVQKEDKVAKKVGSYYVTNASFPFLVTQSGFTMSVSQYYPELKLAVDKFYEWNDEEIKESKMKEEMFKESGIKYVYLNPDKKLEDIGI